MRKTILAAALVLSTAGVCYAVPPCPIDANGNTGFDAEIAANIQTLDQIAPRWRIAALTPAERQAFQARAVCTQDVRDLPAYIRWLNSAE